MPVLTFRPILAGARFSERLVGCLGAAVCIALTMVICAHFLPASDIPVIVAPLGASAVLIFTVPSSPLAQPWPVIGGNTFSALVGVAAFHLIPGVAVAAGVAVGGAILLMSLLRCLHPPGGAAALTAVIGGSGVHAAGYSFALTPVALNSVALVVLALLFHRGMARSYPHQPGLAPPAIAELRTAAGFHPDDIAAALADMHESFDINRDDLDLLLSKAELYALNRKA